MAHASEQRGVGGAPDGLVASVGFDAFFPGIWEGYEGSHDPRSIQLVAAGAQTSDLFYVAHPDVTYPADRPKLSELKMLVVDPDEIDKRTEEVKKRFVELFGA